ncbi:hypothetical protein GB998_11175 [Lactobacillus plantarum]|nr:hypothetical protein [Lactiplantibacillus plantarum]
MPWIQSGKKGDQILKKSETVCISLLLLLFISGCGSSQQASQASHADKKHGVSVVKVKPKVITDKAHKTNDATKATSTSVNASSQSTKITSQQRGATTMNLNEISQGSYGSLLGDWKEVASSVNKHDTKGDVWQSPEAGAKLTVKDTKISDGEMALASGKFEDANGDEEAVTTTIKQEKGALHIDGDIGAAAVTYWFYPKGVAISGWGDNVPATIKTDTERIITRTSNNSYVKVFERQTTAANTGNRKSTMALGQIKTGDYSSLNGTWQNGQGNQIKIHNQRMKFSDFGLTQDATPGTITKLKMDVPSLDDQQGNSKTVDGLKYHQQLTYQTSNGASMLQGSFSISGSSGGLYDVVFMPGGNNADLNNGDSSRDRIAALGMQNDPQNIPSDKIYYRSN